MSDEPKLIDLVHELHKVIYGDTWARPESPREVWRGLLQTCENRLGELDRLRAIVNDLAESEWMNESCPFCDSHISDFNEYGKPVHLHQHDEDCLLRRAVEYKEGQP